MKFALVQGARVEAQPNLKGICAGCSSPMTAKCGEVRLKHWAHQGRIRCDPWWEPETEWHRAWKNNFLNEWQEVIHHANDGEKHIADVKTEAGWVLEFQHSFIKPEERKSREDFYKKMMWVVDSDRSPQYKSRFLKALKDDGFTNRQHPEITAIASKLELLRTWVTSCSHVIFDLGEDDLWWLRPESDEYWSYLVSIPRSMFIEFHLRTDSVGLDAFVEKYSQALSNRGSFPSLTDYYHFRG
jgi:hypothetical protein